MKKMTLSGALCMLLVSAIAQNVAINTNGTTAHSSSILDVNSNNKGMLLPRMSSIERQAISNPEKGLLVFDNDKSGFMYYDGLEWRTLLGGNNAESLSQEQFGPAGEKTNLLAYEMSGDGDYLALSAWDRNDPALDLVGAVHIFHRTTQGTWVWQSKINAPTPQFYDYFGYSTDMEDDFLIIGSPRTKNNNAVAIGYAYVYKRNGDHWQLEATLSKADPQPNDMFGYSVAITTTGPGGVYAAVSAPAADIAASNTGYIGLYRKDAASWVIAHHVTSTDFKANDATGFSIALENDLLVAGAPFKEGTSQPDVGAVYFIRYTPLAWQIEYTNTGFSPNGGHGFSVAIHNNKVAAGAPGMLTDPGRVTYFYRNNNNAWQSKTLNAPPYNGNGLPRFGIKVSLDEDHLLVGASGNKEVTLMGINIDGNIAGQAFIYQIKPLQSSFSFGLQRQFTSSFASNNDHFANSILLNNGYYFIGNPAQSKPGGLKEGAFTIGTYR